MCYFVFVLGSWFLVVDSWFLVFGRCCMLLVVRCWLLLAYWLVGWLLFVCLFVYVYHVCFLFVSGLCVVCWLFVGCLLVV